MADERTERRRVDWTDRRTRLLAGALALVLLLAAGATTVRLLGRGTAPLAEASSVASGVATDDEREVTASAEPAVTDGDPSPEPAPSPAAPEASSQPTPSDAPAPAVPGATPQPAAPLPAEPAPAPVPEPAPEAAQPAPAPATTSALSAGRIVELTNAERRAAGLGDLASSDCAAQQAAKRVAVLVAEGRFEHDPLGPILTACQSGGVAENIALGYANEEALVAGWMGSEGHRRNILGGSTHIGVACADDPRGVLCMQVFLG